MNISFFEKKVVEDWIKWVSAIAAVVSFVFIFLPDIGMLLKGIVFSIVLITLVLIYVCIYLYYKKKKELTLNINNTKVNIFFGDIFKQDGYKVIACNEYFDSLVNEDIVSKKSLHGQLLVNYMSVEAFDNAVENDQYLIKGEINNTRKAGKKQKYQLGQICRANDYFLLAFTRFNEKDEAELVSNEYACCLLEMWKNLNCRYNQEIVSIPLLGDGITRIRDNMDVSKQDLLELMLRTLKTSMMTFKEPSEINIVLYPGKNGENYSKFNFARIKQLFND